ncbi:FkbM family methyltransferase [Streptacidiphilus cavernicola]|uniref:FkbM family methyltransferase n=1 Tax=Streptacidiphilus cavernicola TaxID=3342716 RepID=A0ABV6VZJ2_9ACTN
MDTPDRAAFALLGLARRYLGGTALSRSETAASVLRALIRPLLGSGTGTAAFRGMRLEVPTASSSIAAGLHGGFYERLELDLFEELCARSGCVVDVGANLGVYSCAAARLLPAGALLAAYEPAPGNLALLRRNLRGNTDDRHRAEVLLQECAVGPTAGTVRLGLSSDIGLHAVTLDGSGDHTVPQVALDDAVPALLAARPHLATLDILKIDVEGYDGHALRGARGVLARHRPALMIEFSRPQLARCGFTGEEFVALIEECYDEIHIIEESRNRITVCPPDALLRPEYRSKLLNVVAVSRPEHRAVAAAWAARGGARRQPAAGAVAARR